MDKQAADRETWITESRAFREKHISMIVFELSVNIY